MHPFVRLDEIAVVIVDDDDDIRLSLAKYLRGRGATVFACSTAREALEAVQVHQPNIVLSDIGLPNRDGFQLLEDIRSLDTGAGRNVPVIAMTAFGAAARGNRTRGATFQSYLNKPFRPDQLITTVLSALGDANGEK